MMTTKEMLTFMGLMVPITIGAVCMPLVFLGSWMQWVYPSLLGGGFIGLIIWAWRQDE